MPSWLASANALTEAIAENPPAKMTDDEYRIPIAAITGML